MKSKMIKVTLGEVKTQEKPFPKLMKNIDGTIMFFVDNSKGICLVAGGDTKAGFHTADMSMKNFTDYNEPITIQNA